MLSFHESLDAVAWTVRAGASLKGLAASPRAVSKVEFDQARFLAPAGSPAAGLPSAEAVRQRFGLPWRTVLMLALARADRRGHLLSLQPGMRTPYLGDDVAMCRALQAVAKGMGGSPSAGIYDVEIVAINAERARRAAGTIALPPSHFVVNHFGGWGKALEAAGLETTTLRFREQRRPELAEALLDRCISAIGFMPSRAWFKDWCAAYDIPLGRDAWPWEGLIERTRARRAARGEAMPSNSPPTRRGVYPPLPQQPEDGPRRRRVYDRTREDALASLRRYGARYLEQGARPRYKHYQACSWQDSELVSPSILSRFGRFQDLCRAAGL